MLENVVLFDSTPQDFTKLIFQMYTYIVYHKGIARGGPEGPPPAQSNVVSHC